MGSISRVGVANGVDDAANEVDAEDGEGWHRVDERVEDQGQDHWASVLDEVHQRPVSTVVHADVTIFLQDDDTLGCTLGSKSVDEHVRSEVFVSTCHNFGFEDHAVHVQEVGEDAVQKCAQIGELHVKATQ